MDALEERPFLVWASLACTVATVLLTVHHFAFHWVMYSRGGVRPDLQKCYVRIFLLTSVYSICAWLSLVFTEASGYFDAVRGIYEAYVLYVFAALMLLYDGGEERALYKHVGQKDEPEACYACPCLPTCGHFSSGARALWWWKALVLQFLVVKPAASVATAVLEADHLVLQADPYIKPVVLLSVTLAMAGLLNIYMALRPAIGGLNAGLKFLVVKLAVFFTVWQEVAFHVMVGQGWVSPEEDWYCWWTGEQGGCRRDIPRRGVQTVAVIVIAEMLAFTLLFTCVFSARDPALAHNRVRRRPPDELMGPAAWSCKMLALTDLARAEVEDEQWDA